ncbi:hydantoinase B/oxoprolinase family protein [Micromonospora sp. CB01531]|uniref:hydantoinase B/oxoprolinase family protein n=1 Tax=Micromonospora sp. CB01531 TaxID=1718947 RepID=UPI00093B9E22|nr:hydantoinase B/oxoprolinase family protein [Micromonospora sp. CB01531]OKI63375.1 hydantoin utilization protein B [Micromonospora sp. CB01531]
MRAAGTVEPVGTSPGPLTERFWRTVEVDPVTFRVIGGALKSIAGEMAQILYRMAYSSVIRESEDLGAGLFDVDGREFCESDSTPMHIGSLPAYIRGCNARWRGRYEPDDVIVHNHPFSGSSHSPDYGVLVPIFWQGQHIAFAGCTGHLLDVGGAAPAISIDAIDVYAEGRLLDAVKIESRGVRNEELWRHVMGNVRTGEANAGDVEAMIACCRLGVTRFGELVDRYGIDTVMSSIERWQSLVESRLRAVIEAVPDGTYHAPDGFYDDDGLNHGVPVPLRTSVTVSGSDIVIDLTGSADETPTACNCPFEGSVLPTANYAVRTLFLDEAKTDEFLPQNDGIFRPVSVRAPRGTIFNPTFPRATSGRFPLINRIPDQVNLALAQVLPELVTAGNSASVQGVAYSGVDEHTGNYWVHLEIGEGAYGGRYGRDGIDAVDNLMANTRNAPVEEVELRSPLRCERYELRDHPPAPGRWRGGVGSVRRWRFLVPTMLGANGDSRSDVPRGLFGGADGVSGRLVRNAGRPDAVVLSSRFSGLRFAAGETLDVEVPSGAGYGDPLERDPSAVLADVRDGLYSPDAAREAFGVLLTADGSMLDVDGTAGLRGRRVAEPTTGPVDRVTG